MQTAKLAPNLGRPLVGALACVLLALALGRDRLLSTSVDVGLHLQEVLLVKTHWILPLAAKGFMSELWWYPKLSHRLAAGLANLGFGDIDAMTMVGVFSAAVAWLCLFAWARRVSLFLLAAGGALALLNVVFGASIGGELVTNFFFPQVVAEAAFWLILGGGVWIMARSRWGAAAWLTAGVALIGCIHLLPTLKLAGAGMALFALDAARERLARRRTVWADLAGIVALPAAVVLNPFFGAMRWIAANDGTINFGASLTPASTAAAAALLLALSAAALWLRLRAEAPATASERAVEVLAAVGAATAAAAIAQYLALELRHDGSPYAVKKHAFGVFTLLAFVIPLLLARWAPSRLRGPAPWLAAPAAMAVIVGALFLQPSRLDVAADQRLLHDVARASRATGVHGRGALFASDTTHPMMAFTATIAVLQAPHDDGSVLATLLSGHPTHPETTPHIFTRVGDLYDRPACREGAPAGQVVVVRGACAAFPAFRFGAGQPGVAHLRTGWTQPEIGVWSNGPRARVELPVPQEALGGRGGWLQASTFSFTPAESPRRTVTLRAGAASQTFTFQHGVETSHDFTLPLSAAELKRRRLDVTFEIADPRTPKSLGLSDDPRALGVGLEQIRILPDRRP